jgi:branched-chain amino acid transport system substrate-binding protein
MAVRPLKPVAAVLGAVLAIAMGISSARAADPVRIGLFAPITGDLGAVGVRFREGAQLYVDQVNAQGGIDGRTVELLVEDDRNSPKEAASIAEKFASTPNLVLAIGTFTTTASLSAAPILTEAKIPQISPSSSNPKFTQFSAYQFRENTRDDLLAEKHADIVLNILKAKTVVIPYVQDDFGIFTAEVTKAAIERRGGKVLLTQAVPTNSRDFRPLVSKIISLKPDAIFLPLYYQEGAIFVQQLRQAGSTIPIASPDPLSNPKFVELAGKAADGVLLYTVYFNGDPSKKAFTDAYKAKYGRLPDQWGALAYDSAGVGIAAIRRLADAKKPINGQAVRDEIANGPPYEGVTGETKYDANREVNKTITLITIRDGQYVLY